MDQQQQQKWIAFVSNSGRYIYTHRWDVIRFLIDKGYNILIIAPEDWKVPAFEIPEIKYIPLEFSNKSRNPFSSLKLYSQLKKLYKTFRPVCIFHYAIKANIFGNYAAKKAGIPCVSVIAGTGYSFQKKNWLYLLAKILYSRALRIPKEVWFINSEDEAFFTKLKIVNAAKALVLHGEGINTRHFDPGTFINVNSNDKFSFIIVTRMLYSKGIGTIADATRLLRDKGYNYRCLLLGAEDPGHPDGIPASVIDNWQNEKIYEVIPFAEDVRPWLAKADCFLLPSYYNEGLPQSLLEAASMQLPIITTNQKGCRETIVEDVTGLFCNTNDPADLAAKMESIMNMTADQRIEMGRAGRRLMQEKFDVERICNEYLRVIQKIEAGM